MSRAVETVTRSDIAPALRVLEPANLGGSKDPDAFVQVHGIDSFRELVERADCGIAWRVGELARGVGPDDQAYTRRAALARAGSWLGKLAPRYALEQEDAVRRLADQCGYSRDAVERAFRARFWQQEPPNGRNGRIRLEMER